MANTPLISPGVRINIVDESLYTPSAVAVDNSKAIVIVGAAQFGPFNRPVLVSSVNAFELIFGTPIDIAGLTAINSIRSGGTVYYCRFGDESTASALECVLSDDIKIKAVQKGTLRDGSWIAKTTVSDDEDAKDFTLEIVVKGDDNQETTIVKSGVVSFDPKSDDYYENWNNSYFEIIATSEGTPSKLPTTGDHNFTAGNNGVSATISENATAVKSALKVLSDRDTYTFMYCFVPLYSAIADVAKEIVDISKSRMDATFQIDHPTVEIDNTITNATAASKIATFASTYVGVDESWVAFWAIHEGYIVDPYQNNAQVLAPPSAFIAPAIAAEYAINEPWVAPAGIGNLSITNIARLDKIWTQDERDALYAANVNPVLNYKGLGYTAMGQKNGKTRNTAMNRLNVSQLVNYIRVQSEQISTSFLFAPIDDETFATWRSRITAFLSNIKTRRGLYDFRVKMDWETVTPDAVNQNLMPGIIKIKPTRTAEFIDVDLVIKNYSDTL